jgi:translation elongation factor EF-Ts
VPEGSFLSASFRSFLTPVHVTCHLLRLVIVSYVHNAAGDGLGQSAAVVGLKTDASTAAQREAVAEVARKLAMHVVAAQPQVQ